MTDQTSQPAPSPAQFKETKAEKPLTIMLVDDDAFIIDIYSVKLTERGHTIVPFQLATAALEKLRSGWKPDILVADLIMPHMSGFEFLKIVHDEQLAKGIPIVVMSNQSEPEDYERTRAYGATVEFVKVHSLPREMVRLIEQTYEYFHAPQGTKDKPHQ
jgi:two-component system chemotaxis response regulator CheY